MNSQDRKKLKYLIRWVERMAAEEQSRQHRYERDGETENAQIARGASAAFAVVREKLADFHQEGVDGPFDE